MAPLLQRRGEFYSLRSKALLSVNFRHYNNYIKESTLNDLRCRGAQLRLGVTGGKPCEIRNARWLVLNKIEWGRRGCSVGGNEKLIEKRGEQYEN